LIGEDWSDSGYDIDVMASTIKELKDYLSSVYPTCGLHGYKRSYREPPLYWQDCGQRTLRLIEATEPSWYEYQEIRTCDE
jgi:hypothetical protein